MSCQTFLTRTSRPAPSARAGVRHPAGAGGSATWATSNNYGGGAGERRIGRALAAAGGLPQGFVLATKVDADPATGDFSGERVRRSVAESLERLGLDQVPLMYLHDPEYHLTFAEAMAPGGPVGALLDLRDRRLVGHLGIAGGPVGLMRDFIATDLFEVVLSHNRFTLIDRSAGPLMDDACERGVAFVNGAPYGGGILAKGPDVQPKYAYRPAGDDVTRAVLAMQRACAAHGVSLPAAALQFSLRDPRVTATVVGISEPARIDQVTALTVSESSSAHRSSEIGSDETFRRRRRPRVHHRPGPARPGGGAGRDRP